MNCNYKVQMKDIQNKYKFKIFCAGNGNLSDYYTKNETNALLDAKYDKHTGGIPKADLSNDVQTSLGKADTALQQHQDISGKEDKTNKVTSITSSSTDTQYPSAKAVYTNDQELQTQLDETNERVERAEMVYNALPKVNGSGEVITLENTAETPLKMELSGNTSQFSTTGKNLANINNFNNIDSQYAKLTIANDKITITNNTNTGGYTETYKKVSDICPNLQVGDVVYLFFNSTSTMSNKNKIYLTTPASQAWDNNNTKTITQDMLDAKIVLYGGYNETAVISNFMITKVNDSTYEPYTNGASPNPDYPQDIEVVTGSNTIKVEGKNLFDKDNTTPAYVSSLGDITADITGRNQLSDYIKVEPNTNYIFSANAIINYLSVAFFDSQKQYISRTMAQGVKFNSFNSENSSYIRVWCNIDGTNPTTPTLMESNQVQLEVGSTATTYEPYQSQEYSVNLGSLELCKINDYKDKIKRSSGKNLFDKSATLNDGYIRPNGQIDSSDKFKYTDYIRIEPNTAYTTTGMPNGSGNEVSRGYYTEDKTFISSYEHNARSVMTHTSPANAYYMIESVRYEDINTVQIEKGSQATEYEPYGNIWCKHKEVKKVTLNGSEDNWQDRPNYESVDRFVRDNSFIGQKTNEKNGYSNNFIVKTTSTATYPYVHLNNGQCVINFSVKGTTTLEQFKTWLSTHNTEVYYVLATPTNEPITDTTLINQLNAIEKAYAYQNQTNISQDNADASFIIDAETIYDLSNLVTRVAVLETE